MIRLLAWLIGSVLLVGILLLLAGGVLLKPGFLMDDNDNPWGP